MHLFKKILVPVDFSRNSKEAIDVALSMAGRYVASVKLVHVWQPSDYGLPDGFYPYTPSQVNDLLAAIEKQLDATRKDTQHVAGSISVSSALLQGRVSAEIVRCAKEEKFDLIVMGTHGRAGLDRLMLGSVAEKVLRTAPCPVLAVRSEHD